MLRKLCASLLALFGVVLSFVAAQAQTATPVQQSGSHLDAATLVQAATAAVNTAVTVTLPAVAGQYHYITNISLTMCEDTTGSTALQKAVTTTNLNGWLAQLGMPNLAGSCQFFPFVYPNALKSAAPGTATLLTIAAPGADVAPIANVAYYLAP